MTEPMDYQAQAKAFGISLKELVFVEQYLTDFNGTQAYLRAGYRPTVQPMPPIWLLNF